MKNQIHDHSRRNFVKNSFLAASMLPFIDAAAFVPQARTLENLKVYIFSKHLQFLDYNDMAAAAAEMGFDGVDLTARPEGHVLPEKAESDLPKAVEAMKKAGLSPFMMTTAVDDASDPVDRTLLQTAAQLGFKYYRMNWLPYPENISMPDALSHYVPRIKDLSLLNRDLNLVGCYQNHSGKLVGASLWELWQILRDADKEHMGIQYDIRHAMVEGGESWQNGLRLVEEQIKTLTIKDFKWTFANNELNVQDVPIGEGGVNFRNYFALLKKYNVEVPVSLHIEYPLGGVEHGGKKITVNKRDVFDAMKKDLQKIRRLWQEA